jgi:hypothetical protein
MKGDVMFDALLPNVRSYKSGLHSERRSDSATGEEVYVLQLVKFDGPQVRLVDEHTFRNWDDYRREYDKMVVMLQQARGFGL